jgi:hypothetical protein
LVGFFGSASKSSAAMPPKLIQNNETELQGKGWSCEKCTLYNIYSNTPTAEQKCAACAAPAPPAGDSRPVNSGSADGGASRSGSAGNSRWACTVCTFSNSHAAVCCMCGSLRGTGGTDEKGGKQQSRPEQVASGQVHVHEGGVCGGLTQEQAARVELNRQRALKRRERSQHQQQQPQHSHHQPKSHQKSMQRQPSLSPAPPTGCPLVPPSCKCRAKPRSVAKGTVIAPPQGVTFRSASIQRVRKAGVNHQRLFWSCASRGSTERCKYFMWADEQFPLCSHGRPSTMRRVLKPGANNGRYFFSCASSAKGEQCKLFQWVDDHVQAEACRGGAFRAGPPPKRGRPAGEQIPAPAPKRVVLPL